MQARYKKGQRLKRTVCAVVLLLIVVTGSMIYRMAKADFKADTADQRTDQEAWNLILVNRDHPIPAHYQMDLTKLSNGKKVDSRIYPELQQMFDDARAAGLALFVREGYRTEKEQKQIMKEQIEEYEAQGYSKKEAEKMAKEYVAIPGTSEHQLGLSVDINADTDQCSSDQVYEWLDKNAYKYGFIKRYPEDKTEITGINNEPWHYRYVGKEVAGVMKKENLCLEEYLETQEGGGSVDGTSE